MSTLLPVLLLFFVARVAAIVAPIDISIVGAGLCKGTVAILMPTKGNGVLRHPSASFFMDFVFPGGLSVLIDEIFRHFNLQIFIYK